MGRFVAVLAPLALLVALALGASSRAGAEAEQARLRLVTVRRFDSPLHLASARGVRGRLFVVEQAGRIRTIVNGKVVARPFLDIRSRVLSGGEQGLLSVAFHPAYAKSRRFYVDYTDLNGHTRVVEYRANRAGTRALPGTRRQLLFVRQPYPNHNGGQLAFGPDGGLYVGMGDGGSGGDPENRAQNPASLLGKLIRIDPLRPARRKIAALGLRNPWRFSFDRQTGDLWLGDVGQGTSEEIDYAPRARLGELLNFGWDVYEGLTPFENKALSQGRLVQPVHVYGRTGGYSVTGGFVYRGSAIPGLRGRYLFGDYGSGKIWSLALSGGQAEVRREAITVPELASFGEDLRGELYAVSLAGRVYRILGS
ncbi:MAG: sorbosone dehydrogenase family protein [Gaiellaceae bacterium]